MTRHRPPQQFWGIAGLLGSAAAAALLYLALDIAPYFAWLGGASAALFCLYGFDKRRAIVRGRRVPENVLHGIALSGGFAGGWAGRLLFRHKTRHYGILIVLLLATVVHTALIVWLLW